MMTDQRLQKASSAFARQAWLEAHEQLTALDAEGSLGAEHLEMLATTAYLIGEDEASTNGWTRAHHAYLDSGNPARAARCAYWLALGLFHKGMHARGSGWIGRARRLIDELDEDCVERGYLKLPAAMQCISTQEYERAAEIFLDAAEVGEQCGDRDLVTLARHGRGRALIRAGEIDEGVALIDEAMVAVEANEVSPLVAGDVYCSMIEACRELFDLQRAREWTAALSHWCESHSELVPYRGQCLIRRSEIMQMQGAWTDAMAEAERACRRLAEPPGEPAAGAAFYQQAELLRLQGSLDEAEAAYREASKWGRSPQPGLALLRLVQGRPDDARAAIRRALEEASEHASRATLLPAAIEILLASHQVPEARSAADELSELAADRDASLLTATAAHWTGAVLLAENEPDAALATLRKARRIWKELDAPYEGARTRTLIGTACRRLGDIDSGELEFEAARAVFERLGAGSDLARIDALARDDRPFRRDHLQHFDAGNPPDELTERQVEVLRLIAAGKTNKMIGEELFISEKTVARHVSNIFSRLGLSSRAAATAYAYERDLV